MSQTNFEELESTLESRGADAAIDRLIESIRNGGEYKTLFDALCLKSKHEMGLPLVQPTSFHDVPDDRQEEFEKRYVDAAREVGDLLLAAGDIPNAWVYLRTIREPEKVRAAIDALPIPREPDESTEELINVALYEGANPARGLEIMLHTHGTCNTVTAMDQHAAQLPEEDRRRAAAALVNQLYSEVVQSIQYEVRQRMAGAPPADSLRELFSGRDWLFGEGNYHVDVSHLNAVVRFARFLEPGHEALPKAVELAEYGSQLDKQFQYPGDPPFDDFYPAHVQFLKALAGDNADDAVAYFREKLDAEPDAEDKPYLAYVLMDLLIRLDRRDEALAVASEYLRDVEDPDGFSFSRLCQETGRMDKLQEAARARGDMVRFTAALVQAKL